MADDEAEDEEGGWQSFGPPPADFPPGPPTRAEELAGLAFEVGQRFMASTNFMERSIVAQYLLMGARAAGRPEVMINLQSYRIEPASLSTPTMRLAVSRLCDELRDGLLALGIAPDEIRSATLTVKFDFATARPHHFIRQSFAASMIEPEAVNYDCTVRIADESDEQRVRVPEWWKD
ncbi:MAG TPA: hypothetical protein VKA84_13765 [Gemmatimonadaceae bacterium]|nr:hypothetical protein [Gemmatimonadaceae bacterium]